MPQRGTMPTQVSEVSVRMWLWNNFANCIAVHKMCKLAAFLLDRPVGILGYEKHCWRLRLVP